MKLASPAQQSPEIDSFDILESFSRGGPFSFEPFGLPDVSEDELTDIDVTPASSLFLRNGNTVAKTLPSSFFRDDRDSFIPEDSYVFLDRPYSPAIEKPKLVNVEPNSNDLPQLTSHRSKPTSPMTWEVFEEMALKGIEAY